MQARSGVDTDPALCRHATTLGWIAVGVAVHLVYLSSLRTGWLDLLFNDSSHTPQGFDFAVFRLAGRTLVAGGDIYGLEAAFGFRYLPAFALTVGRFFALFTPRAGYLVYLTATELILLADLWFTWRWQPPGVRIDRCWRARATFMWLVFSPYYLELYMGQVSFWAASLLFHTFCHLERPRASALTWTAAVLIKPNALLLVPALVRLRRFRTLGFCLLTILLTSLPYFLLHPGSLTAFLERNLGARHFTGALTHAGNLGLWGGLVSLTAKLADLPLAELSALDQFPLWGRAAILLPLAGIAAVALFVTFTSRCPEPLSLFSLWLTTYFLVYKDVWEHHYVFLLPVLVLLQLRHASLKLLFIFTLLAIPTPYFLLDVAPGVHGNIDPERVWSLFVSLFYRSFKLVPTLVLWLWLLDRVRRPAAAPLEISGIAP